MARFLLLTFALGSRIAMSITLAPRKMLALLALAVTSIIGAYLGTLVLAYGLGHDHVLGLVSLFDVDQEHNIPAWFSSGLLLTAAVLLALVAAGVKQSGKPHPARWMGLAVVFFFLSFDEAIEIHERLGPPMTALIVGSGHLARYTWVVPYAIAGLLLLLVYMPFLRGLPRASLKRFIVAGTAYALGAFGTEVVGGFYFNSTHTEETLAYDLISGVEEGLEMVGIVWFIYGLLKHVETELEGVLVRVGK